MESTTYSGWVYGESFEGPEECITCEFGFATAQEAVNWALAKKKSWREKYPSELETWVELGAPGGGFLDPLEWPEHGVTDMGGI